MGEGLWIWPNFRLSRARDLDLGSGHTGYHHTSFVDLYLHTKFHCNWRNVLWTDRRTDRHLRPILLGRLRGVDLTVNVIKQQFKIIIANQQPFNDLLLKTPWVRRCQNVCGRHPKAMLSMSHRQESQRYRGCMARLPAEQQTRDHSNTRPSQQWSQSYHISGFCLERVRLTEAYMRHAC